MEELPQIGHDGVDPVIEATRNTYSVTVDSAIGENSFTVSRNVDGKTDLASIVYRRSKVSVRLSV